MAKAESMIAVIFGASGVTLGVRAPNGDARGLTIAFPPDLDASHASDVGAWLRGVSEQHGFKAKRAVAALERRELVTKLLDLPPVADRAADLPGMVRFRLLPQLPFPADGAAVDYVELPAPSPTSNATTDVAINADTEGPAPTEATTAAAGIRVLAAAARQSRVEHVRAACAAAGWTCVGVAPAMLGAAHAARTASAVDAAALDGTALVVAPMADGVELVTLRDGAPIASRWAAIELASADDAARRIATEARRTWLSAEVEAGDSRVQRVVVLGPAGDPLIDATVMAIGEALDLPVSTAGPGAIDDTDRPDRGAAVAAGVLAARAGGLWLDLASPRTPPDRAARKRQLAMAAVLLIILALGGMHTMRNMKLRAIDTQIAAAREQLSNVAASRAEAVRRSARTRHIELWTGTDRSLLEQLRAVGDRLPGNDAVLVQGFDVRAEHAVAYTGRRRTHDYDPARWDSGSRIEVALDGVATDRPIADAVRDAFALDEAWVATTRGADGARSNEQAYPASFELELAAVLRGSATSTDNAADGGDGS